MFHPRSENKDGHRDRWMLLCPTQRGTSFKVTQCSKGLYYFDTDQVNNDENSENFKHYINIQTAKNNKDVFYKTGNRRRRYLTGLPRTYVFSKYNRSPIIRREQSD